MIVVLHDRKRFFMSICRTITAIAGQCIIGVCNADNPRLERNLIAYESIWIPTSIKVFMVVQNAEVDTRIKAQFFDEARTQTGMVLNHKIFGFGKPTRFIDNEFIDGDFANIMDPCSKFEQFQFCGDQFDFLA